MTKETKRRVWRKNLENIKESKDTEKAWRLVKGLGRAGRGDDGKALVHSCKNMQR